jgi:hypothetical protein
MLCWDVPEFQERGNRWYAGMFRSSKRGGIDAMHGVPEFLERGNRC